MAQSKNDFMRYKLMMRPDLEETRQKLAENPEDPEIWYELGMALSNAGDNEAAVDAFSKGISLAPFDPYLYFSRGRKQAASGNFWLGIADLTMATRLDNSLWTFYYYRATTYNLNGYYEEACEDFKQCIRIADDWECCPLVHWLFTSYLLELNDPKRAAEALTLIPKDVVPPQMDYGYHRCFLLYTGQITPDEFVNIPEMEEKCLKNPGRIELELNTMYYGLFAYSVYTGDEERANYALKELMKIAVPQAFGYKKGVVFAKQRGLI
ncbi:MAG: tetratricopeptide repeat protein [Clostridia bacterium]|nr:tetratricopeptide repeat protein [Clostridia bacterium]